MQDFAELHLKSETLAQYGLPDIPYPVPATDLKSALLDKGDLPLAVMLHGLQRRSRDGEAEWQQVEPAMDRLAELLAPDDARDVISAAGDHWRIEVGPVDLEWGDPAGTVAPQAGPGCQGVATRWMTRGVWCMYGWRPPGN